MSAFVDQDVLEAVVCSMTMTGLVTCCWRGANIANLPLLGSGARNGPRANDRAVAARRGARRVLASWRNESLGACRKRFCVRRVAASLTRRPQRTSSRL